MDVRTFEKNQLDSFNRHAKVVELRNLCTKLGMELETVITNSEGLLCGGETIDMNFDDETSVDSTKIWDTYSGFISFCVLYKKCMIKYEDEIECLSWMIPIVSVENKVPLYMWEWEEDSELLVEVKRSIDFLKKVRNLDELKLVELKTN